ncbi:PAS domain S-box protein [Pseudomonas cichorii]|nr:PAS domain S-box protein [Pseudomonas cichorii]
MVKNLRVPRLRPSLYLTLAVGITVSLLSAWVVDIQNRKYLLARLNNEAESLAQATVERVDLYQYGLRGVRGVILTAGENISRDLFYRYSQTRDINKEFPGARGFGFIRRVPVEDQASFLAKARADDRQDFNIRELSPNTGERYVIQYIEPVDRNLSAIGLDIASQDTRRQAALSAMKTGNTTLSGPITLVQESGKPQQSFLILLPIYEEGQTPEGEKNRERHCIGWSYAPLLMSEVLAGLTIDPQKLAITLNDITESNDSSPFYTTDNLTHETPDEIEVEKTIQLYGRTWKLTTAAHPAFASSLNLTSPRSVMVSGLLISVLLALLASLMETASIRRRQFSNQQARISAIVESSTDAIIGKDHQGRVTSWNHGAEIMFGYSSKEAIGKTIRELITPDTLAQEETEILSRISGGDRFTNHHTIRRHKDGHLIDVSVSVSPIFAPDGSVAGASKTVRNISGQKAAEARIHELNADLERQVSERTIELENLNVLLGSILESASEISVVVTDTQGIVKIFNHGAQNMLGYSADEVVDRMTPGLFHLESEVLERQAELSAQFHKPIEGIRTFVEVAEQQGSETREWTYVRKDASHITVSLSVTVVRNLDGTIAGYLGIATDITSRKAFEKELASSLATTRAILATAVNPVITLDGEGMLKTYNPAAERAFGYGGNELEAIHAIDLMPKLFAEQGPASTSEFLSRLCIENYNSGQEVEVLRKDGSSYPAQMSLGIMDSSEDPMFVAIVADLTEQRRQRDEILAAHDHTTLAAEVANLGIWNWDLVKAHLEFNDQMYKLYALPHDLQNGALKYEHWRNRVHPDDIEETELKLNNAILGIGVYDPIFRALLPDGEIRFIQAAARVHYDATGTATRITGINLDITEERRLQTSLREAKDLADAASAAKSSFLANMSHEIRTPMNAVLGMLHLVKQTDLNVRQHDYVSKAHSAATSLLGLLNDILDYSKVESGKLILDIHAFEVDSLLQELSTVLSGNQDGKDVEIMYDLDYNIPGVLIGDRMRLQQILINLAGNALKFTHQGQVTIGIKEVLRKPESIRLCISVKDTGIGISEAQQKIIFDGFTQAEASISRRFGGTGLGLVISRRLVELMGGKLQVDSTLGQGSCFWFEIELAIDSNNSLIDLCGPLKETLNILIVDDNQESAVSLTQMITALGWQADCVNSGSKAVAQVRNAQSKNRHYDIVLMDWQMPELDGLETAQIIQGMTDKPRIIMITAFGREVLAQEQNNLTSVFSDVLTKPVTPSQLSGAITRSLGASAASPPPASDRKKKNKRLEGVRVLVVEDNFLNRQVASELLAAEGAIVAMAEGGLEGVQAVLQSRHPFDAVLMDMQMPDIDGLEATRRIREDQRFTTLPILAMTANVTRDDQVACLKAGMNDHIAKPIDNERLVSCLLSHISGVAPPLRDEPVSARSSGSAVEEKEHILARFGNNTSLIRQVLSSFLTNTETQLTALETALADQNRPSILNLLHTLKGSASTMGAKSLSELAASSEKLLKSGPPDDAVHGISQIDIPTFRKALHENEQALQAMFHETESRPAALVATSDTESWETRLKTLRELLCAGNLDVLEQADTLTRGIPYMEKSQLQLLLQRINELDFRSALNILDDHSRKPEE